MYIYMQVEKAEAVLLELRLALDKDKDKDTLRTLSQEFYSNLTHRPQHQHDIMTKRDIASKQDLCQVNLLTTLWNVFNVPFPTH